MRIRRRLSARCHLSSSCLFTLLSATAGLPVGPINLHFHTNPAIHATLESLNVTYTTTATSYKAKGNIAVQIEGRLLPEAARELTRLEEDALLQVTCLSLSIAQL